MKAKSSANLGLVKIHLEGMTKFLKESCKNFSELMGDKVPVGNSNNQ
jgi:hypothetical protein